ncbi:hypothetical protein Ccrd_006111 [Cynara cardunculus var. scolymus]|uniref:Uncharacterized protein n=1 Tax=Cynara cardunculus var. scolymus TaxID=59895 RepID=A0A118JU19_CYNCS|nr:hypothetical protein Ccrd_006111 [Cynara cardunculus var. scolymus]
MGYDTEHAYQPSCPNNIVNASDAPKRLGMGEGDMVGLTPSTLDSNSMVMVIFGKLADKLADSNKTVRRQHKLRTNT